MKALKLSAWILGGIFLGTVAWFIVTRHYIILTAAPAGG